MANYQLHLLICHVPDLFVDTCPKKFIDWLGKVEHWFVALFTPKEKQVSFAACKF